MELIKAIKTRRSIREYSKKAVPKKVLEAIVDAARFAPTARNVQPWEFVVVTEHATLQKIAELTDHGKFISGSVACILVFSQDTKYFLEDCSAATQNAMLAACAQGVGSCWVALDKKPYAGELAGLVGAPQNCKPVSIIALGYPFSKSSFRVVDKRPLASVVHWERF
jgi:nitroreductase